MGNLLKEMGWVENGQSLELPSNTRLLHEVHVIGIIDARDYYNEQLKKQKEREVRASKEVDTDGEALRKQIEADRQERAAAGPVTKSSVAQKMNNSGPNITRCSDVGIGQSQGG